MYLIMQNPTNLVSTRNHESVKIQQQSIATDTEEEFAPAMLGSWLDTTWILNSDHVMAPRVFMTATFGEQGLYVQKHNLHAIRLHLAIFR